MDGEWMELRTGEYSGPVTVYEPDSSDLTSVVEPEEVPAEGNVIDLDAGRGWVPVSSAEGTFEIRAPAERELEDWRLVLYGLPRVYHKLYRRNVAALFGIGALRVMRTAYQQTKMNRESIGDLRARQRMEGPKDGHELQEELAAMGAISYRVSEDVNEKSQYSRFVVRMRASEVAGRLVIPRSTLLLP